MQGAGKANKQEAVLELEQAVGELKHHNQPTEHDDE